MKKQSSPVMRWHSTTSGRLPGELGDLVQLAGGRPHADDDAQREAQRAGVELGAVAAYHPGLLEPLQPLADGRCGQADAPAERREAEARVGLELQQQAPVHGVDEVIVGVPPAWLSIQRHGSQDSFG